MRVRARLLAGTLLSALGASAGACGGRQTRSDETPAQPPTAGVGSADGGTQPVASGAGGMPSGAGGGMQMPTAGKAPQNAFPCNDATPVDEAMPGFEHCVEGGPVYRAAAEACPSELPRANVPYMEFATCHADSECTEKPHGFCSFNCGYGCVVDADCSAGELCWCEAPVGRCIPATCTTDADCGDGFRCQSYEGLTPEGYTCDITRFACQSAADTCGNDADCPMGLCNADSGHFECRPRGADCSVVGRPFLVAGAPRVATLREGHGWSSAGLRELEGFSPDERAAAARAWAEIGLMEHASVAAFARFALQLLSFGAPAELVELTARAMADELEHAKLAFSLARALGGGPVEPGPLNVDAALAGGSLPEVVRLVVREGCIGETVAALGAREAAAYVDDAALRLALERVADDETRHAELAWRFVRWAIAHRPELGGAVADELALAEQAVPVFTTPGADEPDLRRLGILPQALQYEVRARALAQVIAPCVAHLLSVSTFDPALAARRSSPPQSKSRRRKASGRSNASFARRRHRS